MPERNKIIYLDNNATTRLDNRVLEAMLPYFTTDYANASSSHLFGLTVNEAVEAAREQVATLIGARPKEITFTSGATEAINLAIKGLVNCTKKHIVTVVTEHKAVLDTCAYMQRNGFEVTYLPVNQLGLVNLEDLEAAIRPDTLLVCVMLANNETGVIQPVSEISSLAHTKGALFMTDATQAVGKLPVDVQLLGIDLMPLSAHKFYGPKGISALYVSAKTRQLIEAQQHGGGHERKLRSGTLNVPGILGLGKACEIAEDEMNNDKDQIEKLRNYLENELLKITDTNSNGSKEHRLYNITNLCFKGISSEKLILSLQNIAVSNGSACSAVTTEPSYVLKALALTDADALASIRFSLGRFTTIDDIETTITKVTELVATQRQTAG